MCQHTPFPLTGETRRVLLGKSRSARPRQSIRQGAFRRALTCPRLSWGKRLLRTPLRHRFVLQCFISLNCSECTGLHNCCQGLLCFSALCPVRRGFFWCISQSPPVLPGMQRRMLSHAVAPPGLRCYDENRNFLQKFPSAERSAPVWHTPTTTPCSSGWTPCAG